MRRWGFCRSGVCGSMHGEKGLLQVVQEPNVLVLDQRSARVGTSLSHVDMQGYARRVAATWEMANSW